MPKTIRHRFDTVSLSLALSPYQVGFLFFFSCIITLFIESTFHTPVKSTSKSRLVLVMKLTHDRLLIGFVWLWGCLWFYLELHMEENFLLIFIWSYGHSHSDCCLFWLLLCCRVQVVLTAYLRLSPWKLYLSDLVWSRSWRGGGFDLFGKTR